MLMCAIRRESQCRNWCGSFCVDALVFSDAFTDQGQTGGWGPRRSFARMKRAGPIVMVWFWKCKTFRVCVFIFIHTHTHIPVVISSPNGNDV